MTQAAAAKTTGAATTEADAEVDRALDRMAAGAPAEAIPHLRCALGFDPGHGAATQALIRALEDTGELDEALAIAQRRIADEPDDVLAHTRLSIVLQKMGRVPEAEAAAARAKILGWKLELRSGIESMGDSTSVRAGGAVADGRIY
jgi:tetratricopeptide (TPR) repeat protein